MLCQVRLHIVLYVHPARILVDFLRRGEAPHGVLLLPRILVLNAGSNYMECELAEELPAPEVPGCLLEQDCGGEVAFVAARADENLGLGAWQ